MIAQQSARQRAVHHGAKALGNLKSHDMLHLTDEEIASLVLDAMVKAGAVTLVPIGKGIQ